jgi:hypothetical protein
VLEIEAAQRMPAGAEIHNTYGEHGGEELVAKYGFCLAANPFNEVALDKQALLAGAAALQDKKEARLRSKFLRDERWAGGRRRRLLRCCWLPGTPGAAGGRRRASKPGWRLGPRGSLAATAMRAAPLAQLPALPDPQAGPA